MKVNPNLVFIDTSEGLSELEEAFLQPSYKDIEELCSEEDRMVQGGFLQTFEVGKKVYLLNPEKTVMHSFSIRFVAPKTIEDVRTRKQIFLKGEEDKIASLRRFIAHWICKVQEVKNNKIVQKLVYLYTKQVNYMISVPDFLLPEFLQITKDAGLFVQKITPDIRETVCPYCKTPLQDSTFEPRLLCTYCGMPFAA